MRTDPLAYAYGAVIGFLGDRALGDPQRGHPVAAFGRAAGAVERRLWRDHRGHGALHTAVCAGGAALVGALLTRAARGPAGTRPAAPHTLSTAPAGRPVPASPVSPVVPASRATTVRQAAAPRPSTGRPVSAAPRAPYPLARISSPARAREAALTALATWAVLGGTTLGREARTIGAALTAGDLDAARAALPRLCGRDPQALDAQQIARAVVESVAENTSDAVVGALVWGAVGGVPGLLGFRAVNTLDAMVGHRSPRYLRFGWASARLDDLVGWPGARLTAALAVLAGPAPGRAWRTVRRDAGSHPSPNAGPVEAAFAGALGVRLGGTLAYAGRVEHRPVLGAEHRPVEVADIERAVRLSRRVSALALAASVAGRLAYGAATAGNHRGDR
ncbi:cobalamin biosynthesis protein [Streptomyces sp. 796.1]|uniref:cobalamin biosynthesis protein n=1 Tax=Streptomyces sp. 796.1 TaxID=3163029 RepID=UPI0039C98718